VRNQAERELTDAVAGDRMDAYAVQVCALLHRCTYTLCGIAAAGKDCAHWIWYNRRVYPNRAIGIAEVKRRESAVSGNLYTVRNGNRSRFRCLVPKEGHRTAEDTVYDELPYRRRTDCCQIQSKRLHWNDQRNDTG